MSQASNSRPGIASPVVKIKKLTQSIWSASQPTPDDRTVRPAAISEVSSAYCVPVKATLPRLERYAPNATDPTPQVKLSYLLVYARMPTSCPTASMSANNQLVPPHHPP